MNSTFQAFDDTKSIDALGNRSDARALDRIGIEFALSHQVLPLHRGGAITPIAAPSAAHFTKAQVQLAKWLGDTAFCPADAGNIKTAIATLRDQTLAQRATLRTPKRESCRGWSTRRLCFLVARLTSFLCMGMLFWPSLLSSALLVWVTLTLLLMTSLRVAAAVVEFRHAAVSRWRWTSSRNTVTLEARLPSITLLVPLYDEAAVSTKLIPRIQRLDYPSDKLETLLVLEGSDRRTATALSNTALPKGCRIVSVPDGTIRTKPRAMNYALDFARGDIIGIYDAEDAPAPDQLRKIAQAFATSGPETACVQGVLDFYNARQNWLTRCFTIDYAAWFRLILPGLVRLGLVIPLGGTTVFFRRTALESLGRWDAHNVTEDADIGIRLARRGYRVKFAHSVTREEATASIPAWLRQRSRWIKGYAVTWAVHTRDPRRLWGELGALRFIALQILLLGTLSQFLLAPLLWSFWLVLLGANHPFLNQLEWQAIVALGVVFLLSEILNLAVAAIAVATPNHRWLLKWVPTLPFYYPLAAIASWKAFAELFFKPFFWDKTAHGAEITRQ